jgi:hypothetical protein
VYPERALAVRRYRMTVPQPISILRLAAESVCTDDHVDAHSEIFVGATLSS